MPGRPRGERIKHSLGTAATGFLTAAGGCDASPDFIMMSGAVSGGGTGGTTGGGACGV
ncbi:MAG: hypothetical protein LBE17_13665 [Treponema sp.]|nr:hypothetical protein [Treponema sp.]